jgi:tellurite methyltransferase
MSRDDIARWDKKYASSDRVKVIQPDVELNQYRSLWPRGGAVLDLACGLGKNALFLAQQGMQVTAVDGSAVGLERLGTAARAHNLHERMSVLEADLDDYNLPDSGFEMIIVVRYLNRALFAQIERALKPGALLMYKTFNQKFLLRKPGFNPAYTIETESLIRAFSALDIVADNRSDSSSEYAFMIGRKPGPFKRPILDKN